MIFEFDRWIDGKAYPNLARWEARPFTLEWRQFSHHWPFSEPPILVDYLQEEAVAIRKPTPFYLVAVSFFDYNVDWISLLPMDRLKALRQRQLIMVFYYSEGDNPKRMIDHLKAQFSAAGVDTDQLRVISANSSADSLKHGVWFPDDEILFRKRNHRCESLPSHDHPRSRLFTALVRTHKWWRATVMADFWRRGWHQQGYFSYNPALTVGDQESDNPIEVDRFDGLRAATHRFLRHQFTADDLSSDQHNDHRLVVPDHFTDSYLNVILETHMDVDQSGGVFLTEKTFKPIKNAQPFVVFGAAHSLARLRDLGYKTFDSVIDPAYDSITDTTDRYQQLMQLLASMFEGGLENMHGIYQACKPDILHNQQHFLASKKDRLNRLLEQI